MKTEVPIQGCPRLEDTSWGHTGPARRESLLQGKQKNRILHLFYMLVLPERLFKMIKII